MIRVEKRKSNQEYCLYSKNELYLGKVIFYNDTWAFEPSTSVIFRAKSLKRIAKIMKPIKEGAFDD